jgi:hypothetical protein
MAFHIRDEATDTAVRDAVEHELEEEWKRLPLADRIKPIQQKFKALSRPGGLPADKPFYDELSGEDELTGLP